MDTWAQSTKKQKSGVKKSPVPSPGRGVFSGSVNIHTLTRLPRDEGPQNSTSTALRLGGQVENPADSTGYAEACGKSGLKDTGDQEEVSSTVVTQISRVKAGYTVEVVPPFPRRG